MKTYINPEKNVWPEILKRPLIDVSELYGKVQSILDELKKESIPVIEESEYEDGVKRVKQWEKLLEEYVRK